MGGKSYALPFFGIQRGPERAGAIEAFKLQTNKVEATRRQLAGRRFKTHAAPSVANLRN